MAANMAGLASRVGINTMVELINRDVVDLDAFRAEVYYDQYMLDKIKITQDNYIFLQYAKPFTLPKGHEKWTIRRSFPLTEHTTPLLEGIPPRSDKTRKEKLEGVYSQYGRYMEFSDRVEWKLLDPIMMEYADEYGDVAVRTMHRLARKELLNSTMKFFANNKMNIGELEIGDTVGLATFRLVALKLARLLVRPIGSVYPVITSPEHFHDLMKDPLILEYIGTNNGMEHYKTGTLPELFGIQFKKTQFDDFTYGYELANTGEYTDGSTIKSRMYAEHPGYLGEATGDASKPYYYVNVDASGMRTVYAAAEYRASETFGGSTWVRSEEEGLGDLATNGTEATEQTNRLSDGSWIPIRVVWDTRAHKVLGLVDVAVTAAVTTETQIGTSAIYYKATWAADALATLTLYFKEGSTYTALGTLTGTANGNHTFTAVSMDTVLPSFKQLPVHKAILLGDEALAKLEVTGEGNVKMFAKQKGSAGVLDPIDQRQSIGFKINTIGFKLIREEACWVFYHVPTQAPATAGITAANAASLVSRV